MIMGFKNDVRAELDSLAGRVDALETLAAQVRAGSRVETLTPSRPAVGNAPATGVDYGAVAFGLAEIKRRVQGLASSATVTNEYRQTVQYFADCFKADPSFDEESFKRAAGV